MTDTGSKIPAGVDAETAAGKRTEVDSSSELAQLKRQVQLLREELDDRQRQVEAARKEMDDFSYSVSHDLRAPIRHINGYLELLDQEALACLDDKSRYCLTAVAKAARRLSDMMEGILAFSRLGRAELMKNQIEMDQLVQEVVQEQAQTVPDRQIDWQISPLPVVVADRVTLRQALSNLIANAIKFSDSSPSSRIEIGALDQPGETSFFVRDSVAGFDMRYADKLFGMFQRLHPPDEFPGTGAGLANVQRIISRHGGRVWAEGEVGKGATFWFSLPKAEESKHGEA